jgi:hypothetical protein
VIAQRTLASSEEALETLEAGDARARLEEDIEALRTSLVSIEARLHEVQKASWPLSSRVPGCGVNG